MLGHRHTPAGITPRNTGAAHRSAVAASVSNRAAINSVPRQPYVVNNTRISYLPVRKR
jgi:hypothetical protein